MRRGCDSVLPGGGGPAPALPGRRPSPPSGRACACSGWCLGSVLTHTCVHTALITAALRSVLKPGMFVLQLCFGFLALFVRSPGDPVGREDRLSRSCRKPAGVQGGGTEPVNRSAGFDSWAVGGLLIHERGGGGLPGFCGSSFISFSHASSSPRPRLLPPGCCGESSAPSVCMTLSRPKRGRRS